MAVGVEHGLVGEVVVEAAVDLVRSALSGEVEHGAEAAAELGGEITGLERELADGFDRGGRDGAGPAVSLELVTSMPSTRILNMLPGKPFTLAF
jgi:hypothetical protein